MLSVVTFLWSDPERKRDYTFTSEHVRIWANMVRRNLTVPHYLRCVTDISIHTKSWDDILASGVCPVSLDTRKHVPGTCFVKLMVWRPDIANVLGERILLTDLDIVITGNIDSLVDRDEDVVLYRNPNFTEDGNRAFYQGSLQLLKAGSRPFLWEDFDPATTPQWVNRRFGGAEQVWLSEKLPWDEAHWTDKDGVYGAGRLFNGTMGEGVQTELPADAKIVVVPGNRAPWQEETQKAHPWIAEYYR